MTDDIYLKIKCLELAIQANPIIPTIEVHKLADKFQHYAKTGEWLYEAEPEGKTKDSGDSNEE